MRRIILSIILVFVLVGQAAAVDLGFLAKMRKQASGPVYTDCSQLGTHSFYWNGDHATSNVTACKSGGTLTGTLSNATIVASGTDPGTASPTSGGNVLKATATNNRFRFAASGIFSSAEGQFCGDIWLIGSTNSNYIFNFTGGANDLLNMTAGADGKLTLTHKGNNVSVIIGSDDAVPDTTWTRVCARWSVTNNQIGIKIGSGSWKADSDADAVTAFATEPTNFDFPTDGFKAVTDGLYMDNVTLDTASGL
jgi:hypothetical protein